MVISQATDLVSMSMDGQMNAWVFNDLLKSRGPGWMDLVDSGCLTACSVRRVGVDS